MWWVMKPNERLKEIVDIKGALGCHPDDVAWLITRVKRLTETLEKIREDSPIAARSPNGFLGYTRSDVRKLAHEALEGDG